MGPDPVLESAFLLADVETDEPLELNLPAGILEGPATALPFADVEGMSSSSLSERMMGRYLFEVCFMLGGASSSSTILASVSSVLERTIGTEDSTLGSTGVCLLR